jgi:hypothetical protein
VIVHRVDVKPWVVDDVSTALKSHNPLFRPILGRILFEWIIGPAAQQRWRWSRPLATWEEGDCPPDKIRQAIFTAMG